MVPNVEQEWLYSNGLPLQQRTNKNDYKNRLHCILWCYCFIALTILLLTVLSTILAMKSGYVRNKVFLKVFLKPNICAQENVCAYGSLTIEYVVTCQ